MSEIDGILKAGVLEPGHAGKLKGKLMFAASQLWGQVGRAFLRPLSERQYGLARESALNETLAFALKMWRFLVTDGRPRSIDSFSNDTVDVVVFTDGSFPDGKVDEDGPPMIGALLIDVRSQESFCFEMVVPQLLIDTWIPRKNQIAMIELLAPVIVNDTFPDRLEGAKVLLLIDSEPVEGALIKGYSSKQDVCELVGVFWSQACNLQVAYYIDRVPTDGNPADFPSHGKSARLVELGCIRVEARLPVDGWRLLGPGGWVCSTAAATEPSWHRSTGQLRAAPRSVSFDTEWAGKC